MMSIVDKVKDSYGPVEGGERECELGPEGFASESEHVNIARTDDMAVSTLTGGRLPCLNSVLIKNLI